MKIINNRFRVTRELGTYENQIEFFEVLDLWDGDLLRELMIVDVNKVNKELSNFLMDWFIPASMAKNPYFDSLLLFETLDFENSKPSNLGKLVIVLETYDYLKSDLLYLFEEELDMASFIKGGMAFLKEAGIDIDLSEEDVYIINDKDKKYYRFKDIFTIKINSILRRKKEVGEYESDSNLSKKLIESFKLYGKKLKDAYDYTKSLDKYVLKVYEIFKTGNPLQVVGIKGESGSGKSDILQIIKLREALRNNIIFSDFTLGKINGDKYWDNLMYRFFPSLDDTTDTGYMEDLSFLNQMKSVKKLGGHSKLQKKLPGIRKIIKTFMYYVTDQCVFLMFDNIHLAEEMDLEIISFLIEKFHETNELSVIISYDESSCEGRNIFLSFLDTLRRHGLLIELPIQTNKKRLAKMPELTNEEEEILKSLSVFRESVSIEYLKEVTGIKNGRKIIEGLIVKEVLEQINVVGRVVYSFESSYLKSLCFRSLGENEKKKIIKRSVDFLMDNEENNYDEILHQLQMLGDKKLLEDYSLNMAKKMRAAQEIEMSIFFYEIALENIEEGLELLKVYENLVDYYYILGRFDELEELLKKIAGLARERDDMKFKMLEYEGRISLAIFKSELDKAEELIKVYKGYVEESKDFRREVKLAKFEGDYLFRRCKLDESYLVLEQVIEDSKGIEELNMVRSNAWRIFGIVTFFKPSPNLKQQEKALKASYIFNDVKRFARKVGDINGEIKCINNLANIKSDSGKYREALEDYKKALRLSEKIGLIDIQITLLNNIASTRESMGEYELAYQSILHTLKLIESTRIDNGKAFALMRAISSANAMNWIDTCEGYINELKGTIESGNYQRQELWNHYEAHGMYLMRLMEYEKIIEMTEETYKLTEDIEKNTDKAQRLPKIVAEIVLFNSEESTKSFLKTIEEINLEVGAEFDIEVNSLLSYLYYLFKIKDLHEVMVLLDAALSLKDKVEKGGESIIATENKAFMIYFQFLKGEADEKLLGKALNYSRENKYNLLKIDLFTARAELFYEEGEYDYGLSLLLEAEVLIKSVMADISDKNKLKFFNSQGFGYILKFLENYTKREERPSRIFLAGREEMEDLLSKDYSKELDIEEILGEVWKYQRDHCLETFDEDFIESYPYFYYLENNSENLRVSLKYFADNFLAKNATCFIFNELGLPEEYIRLFTLNKDYTDEFIQNEILEWKKEGGYKKILLKQKGSVGSNALVIQPLNKINEEGEKEVFACLVLEFDKAYNYSDNKYCADKKSYLNLLSFVLFSDMVRRDSYTDKLTGLLTRKRMEELTEKLISKGEESFYFLFYDIDKFKSINDKYGHRFGDTVLKMISSKVSSIKDRDNLLGRMGGEEFLLLVRGEQKDIVNYAENLRQLVSTIDYESVGHPDLMTTISIGISKFPEDGKDYETIYENADRAMYKSKESGRNKVSVYEKGLVKKVKKIDELAGILGENEVVSSRNIRIIVEMLQNIRTGQVKKSVKLFLKTLKNTFNASYISLIEVREGGLRILTEASDNDAAVINEKFVKEVVDSKEPIAIIDWEREIEHNKIVNTVEWNSVMVLPVLYDCAFKNVIYISTNYKKREYCKEDINLAQTLINTLAKELSI